MYTNQSRLVPITRETIRSQAIRDVESMMTRHEKNMQDGRDAAILVAALVLTELEPFFDEYDGPETGWAARLDGLINGLLNHPRFQEKQG